MAKRIAIIGGGVAGLLLTRRLQRSGVAVTLFDDPEGSSSSEVPGALVHAFPGRSMRPQPGVLAAFRESARTMRILADAGVRVFEGAIARPLDDTQTGRRLLESFQEERSNLPEWIEAEIVDEPKADPRLVFAEDVERCLVYEPAFCVDLPQARQLLLRGVDDLRLSRVVRLTSESGVWDVELTDGAVEEFDRVVIASGASLGDWFDGADLRLYEGDVLVVSPPEDASLPSIWSGGGHVAPLPREDGSGDVWIVGSTYREPGEPDPEEIEDLCRQLLRRLSNYIPALSRARVLRRWAGTRAVVHPDRMPVVGPVPSLDGVWVLGGFGSKGLLWIPRCVTVIADAILENAGVPDEISISRTSVGEWTPGSRIIS